MLGLVVATLLTPLHAPTASSGDGPGCAGRRATVAGTSGRDVLRGTRRSDVIAGGDRRDLILARDGRDLICAGRGRDRARGGPGDDRLLGQDGSDTLDGDDGDDAIRGGRGADACFQGSGSGHSEGCVPVVAAAGDIACPPNHESFNDTHGSAYACRMRATSDLLLRTNIAAVLALGDTQYSEGQLVNYRASYDPTWGRAKAFTRPVPGNHEYRTEDASGYFTYFGDIAGDPERGYYSFNLGGWHLVGLNTSVDCKEVGGCSATSPQGRWLAADLAADPARCTLAYWHEPLFSSRPGGNGEARPFWRTLSEDGGDVVLSGHAHVYERFSPQTPDGAPSDEGIRQFTVGTGGMDLGPADYVPTVNSIVRQATTFGVLELALRPNGYDWRFVSEQDAAVPFIDEGSAPCH